MSNFHVDLSIHLNQRKTTGIACISARTREHRGCALDYTLKKQIEKKLCIGDIRDDYARLYAICIFLIITDFIKEIKTLIICNDEEFSYVKKYLQGLLPPETDFEIISITEFKEKLGKNIKSLADNMAGMYRKRALKSSVDRKPQLFPVKLTFSLIKELWDSLDK